jgi:hypothetical protein
MLVGLVRSGDWGGEREPLEPEVTRPPRRPFTIPWRQLAWLLAAFALLFAGPPVAALLGGLAGYGLILLAATLTFWRIERLCARQYWRGLRDYQA